LDMDFENSHQVFTDAERVSKFWGLECNVYLTSEGKFVIAYDNNPFADTNSSELKRDKETYVNDVKWSDVSTRRLVPSTNYPNFSERYTTLTPFEQYQYDFSRDWSDPIYDNLRSLKEIIEDIYHGNYIFISFQESYIRTLARYFLDMNNKHRLQQLCWYRANDPGANPNSNTNYKELVDGTNDSNIKYDISVGDENATNDMV
jgi:hypothetical protein